MGIILLFVWILLLKLVGMEEYDLLQRESAVWEFFVLLLVCTGYGENSWFSTNADATVMTEWCFCPGEHTLELAEEYYLYIAI